MFPPSPALSTCDSLDGIDDLDAFLTAQGSLSHFPTPPLRKTLPLDQVEIVAQEIDAGEHASPKYRHIATALAEEASIDVYCLPEDVELVRRVLIQANLPLEAIALAFNILAALHARALGLGRFTDSPPDLLVVATLSLADSYTNDNPHGLFWWSHHVCDDTWTARRIDSTLLKLFASLDYQLHEYTTSERIEEAMFSLSAPAEPDWAGFNAQTIPTVQPVKSENPALRLLTDNASSACWENGQLTPEATPSPSAYPITVEICAPLTRFIPLL